MKLNFKLLAITLLVFAANVQGVEGFMEWMKDTRYPVSTRMSAYLYSNVWTTKIKPHPIATGTVVTVIPALIVAKLYKDGKLNSIIAKTKNGGNKAVAWVKNHKKAIAVLAGSTVAGYGTYKLASKVSKEIDSFCVASLLNI